MTIAQSAASFVGTKAAAKPAAAPKSRKPSAPKADHNQKVMAPAPSSIVSMFAEQQIAAPKAEAKPKAPKVPTMVILTTKGAKFSPDPKRSKVKHEQNANTWATIKALFDNASEVSLADVRKAIPAHTDFVGYALRSGWLAAA